MLCERLSGNPQRSGAILYFKQFEMWEKYEYDSYNNSLNTMRPKQSGCHFPGEISNGFPWRKIYEFRLRYHWSLRPCVHLTIFGSSDNHYLNQWWLVYRHIYEPLGLQEFKEGIMWCIYGVYPRNLIQTHNWSSWIHILVGNTHSINNYKACVVFLTYIHDIGAVALD